MDNLTRSKRQWARLPLSLLMCLVQIGACDGEGGRESKGASAADSCVGGKCDDADTESDDESQLRTNDASERDCADVSPGTFACEQEQSWSCFVGEDGQMKLDRVDCLEFDGCGPSGQCRCSQGDRGCWYLGDQQIIGTCDEQGHLTPDRPCDPGAYCVHDFAGDVGCFAAEDMATAAAGVCSSFFETSNCRNRGRRCDDVQLAADEVAGYAFALRGCLVAYPADTDDRCRALSDCHYEVATAYGL